MDIPILILLNVSVLLASNSPLLNPSTTIRNNNGDSGKPFLSPLLGLKEEEASPLINIEKDTSDIHLITQLINGIYSPIYDIIILKYSHLTLP